MWPIGQSNHQALNECGDFGFMNAVTPSTTTNSRMRDHIINFGLAGLLFGTIQILMGTQSGYVTPRWALVIHLFTVFPAFLLGAWILWRPKGTAAHRLVGRIWTILMLITAIDSFWIRSLTGGISIIHFLSAITLVSIPFAIWHARNGRIDSHMRSMRTVYISLCIAGLFAMLPGRIMGDMIFG